MKIERFEDIEGWKLARELTRMVYDATKGCLEKGSGANSQMAQGVLCTIGS